MNTTPIDTELLATHHFRRRWIVLISLTSLLALFLVFTACLVLASSSSISIEGAKALYAQLSQKSTPAEVKALLGKPFKEDYKQGRTKSLWLFTNNHLNQFECYAIELFWDDDGSHHQLAFSEGTHNGWDAWLLRSWMLLVRLGFSVE